MMSENHLLIRANIALFAGDVAETRRLLQAYRTEGGGDPEHLSLVMWLDAQVQTDHHEYLKRLQLLIANTPPEDQYARLAQQVLDDEALTTPQAPKPGAQLFGVSVWKAGLFAGIGALLMLLVMVLLPPPAPDETTAVLTVPTAAATAAPLPSRRQPLSPGRFTLRYPQGILSLIALEDTSERVQNPTTGDIVTPIPGARFYAFQFEFECRGSVCSQPPEAQLALRLDDGTVIEPRTDVTLAGEAPLQPVALGRTTTGWAIFEIPLVIGIEALVITPTDATNPLTLDLNLR